MCLSTLEKILNTILVKIRKDECIFISKKEDLLKTITGIVVISTLVACADSASDDPPSVGKSLVVNGEIHLNSTGILSYGRIIPQFADTYAAEKNSVRCVTGSGPLIAGEGNINADTGVFSLTTAVLQNLLK